MNRFAFFAVQGAVCMVFFAGGFVTANMQNAGLLESIRYTTLLTEARWRLQILDSVDMNDVATIKASLGSVLSSDKAELEIFRQAGKLGPDGDAVLQRVNARLSNSKSR